MCLYIVWSLPWCNVDVFGRFSPAKPAEFDAGEYARSMLHNMFLSFLFIASRLKFDVHFDTASNAGVQGSSMAIFVSKVWKSRKAGRIVGMMGDKTSMYPVTPSIREAFTDVKEFNFETPSPDAVNIAAQERESPKNVGCVTKNMKNMAPISNTLEGSIS